MAVRFLNGIPVSKLANHHQNQGCMPQLYRSLSR